MTTEPWTDWLGLLGKRRTLARWHELLGNRFEQMRLCLKRTGAPVRFVACPECGCNHRVFPDGNGFHAVCSCEACDCDDILLKPADAEAWLFDPLLFAHKVQSALGTLGEIQPVGSNVLDLGGCPKHEKGGHALLLFGIAEDALKIVPELVVRKNMGCILLSPAMRATEKLLSVSEIPIVRLGDVCKSLASGVQGSCNGACKRLPRDLSNREVVEQLRPPIYELCKTKEEMAQKVAEKTEELGQMASDPDGTVARIIAGFTCEEDRNLFFLLREKSEKNGKLRPLTYEEIGQRLGGITKQGTEKRVKRFKAKYAKVWSYLATIRKPTKTSTFSEIGPKARRRAGIDESYGYSK